MRPVLRGVSLALASCLSLLGANASADPGPEAEYGVPRVDLEPTPDYGVEPAPEPPKALMVTGTVTDAAGKALKGVKVSLSGDETTTDKSGTYALFWPLECAEPCEVVFTHAGYQEVRVPQSVEDGAVQRRADATLEKR